MKFLSIKISIGYFNFLSEIPKTDASECKKVKVPMQKLMNPSRKFEFNSINFVRNTALTVEKPNDKIIILHPKAKAWRIAKNSQSKLKNDITVCVTYIHRSEITTTHLFFENPCSIFAPRNSKRRIKIFIYQRRKQLENRRPYKL